MRFSSLFPIQSSAPRHGPRYFPIIATYVILAVNVIIFALMTAAGGSKNVSVLLNFGASYGPYFRAGQYWRLVMPMFLHIGLPHLAVNMFALCILGAFLEPLYGYGRFTLLYVISGMGGALLSMEASSHIAAGASGAIFGIAGAMLVIGLLHPGVVPRRWKNLFGAGILAAIVVELVFGRFIQHIDNWAHLGGLLVGLFLAWLIPPPRLSADSRSRGESRFQPVILLPVIIVLIALGATANSYFKTQQVARLLTEAGRLEATHRPEQARAMLEKAQRLDSRSPRVHEELGALALSRKDYRAAIREFSEALRFQSEPSPSDTLLLATAYEASGDLTKAREVLQGAQRKMPPRADLQEALAGVSTGLKLYPEAIQHYREALKLAPNSPLANNNLAWLYATCENRELRDPPRALEYALRAVRLTGWRVPDFIDTLAAALFANGQFKLAAETEARVVQLAPGNPEFQENLARYQKAAGL
ncbi:MAG: rhomboid family intramembrane serine protease [Terriglobia bacterium]